MNTRVWMLPQITSFSGPNTSFSGPSSALVGLIVLSMKMTTFYVRAGFWPLSLENCKCDALECVMTLKVYENNSVKAAFLSLY